MVFEKEENILMMFNSEYFEKLELEIIELSQVLKEEDYKDERKIEKFFSLLFHELPELIQIGLGVFLAKFSWSDHYTVFMFDKLGYWLAKESKFVALELDIGVPTLIELFMFRDFEKITSGVSQSGVKSIALYGGKDLWNLFRLQIFENFSDQWTESKFKSFKEIVVSPSFEIVDACKIPLTDNPDSILFAYVVSEDRYKIHK